ncbi:MAG: glycosyltransferase family 2 protein [Acidimicrobiales bacterium]
MGQRDGGGYRRHLCGQDAEHTAKAGNINEALALCDAELIGFLDADHIPSEGFLRDTIGYFDDPMVGLVQTPQDFYNTESFEHIGDFCEEELFYRVIQPGKNFWGGAFWCGTSAIVRSRALRSVGGVATDSVTEDLLTTIRIHSRGWQTVFHNVVLARGLAPTTYTEYLVQRRRWASGAMQILRSSENPLIAKGLTRSQRLAHMTSLLGWFEGARTMGYLLLAVVVAITNIEPVQNSLVTFIVFHLVVVGVSQLAMHRLGQGRHRFFPSLLFDYLRLPATITALSQLAANGRLAFQVTPKGRASDKVQAERLIPPAPSSLLVLLALTQLVWLLFLLRGLGVVPGTNEPQSTISAIVLLVNSVILALALKRIRMGHFGDERRRARRFSRELTVLINGKTFRLKRPSTSGGFIEGRPTIGRQRIDVLTREGTVAVDCWVADHDGEGSTVEFVPGQWATRGQLARTMYLEAIEVAEAPTLRSGQIQEPIRPTAPKYTPPVHRS